MSGVVVDPSSPEFINAFMQRAMVVLNAQRMIDAGAFQ
jgi:hypothetical protein